MGTTRCFCLKTHTKHNGIGCRVTYLPGMSLLLPVAVCPSLLGCTRTFDVRQRPTLAKVAHAAFPSPGENDTLIVEESGPHTTPILAYVAPLGCAPAAQADMIYAVGGTGTILSSSDGTTWASRPAAPPTPSRASCSPMQTMAGPWAIAARSCTRATAAPPGRPRPAAPPTPSKASPSPMQQWLGGEPKRHDRAHEQRRHHLVDRTSGTSNNLQGVAFADANNGWAVGLSATIVHTSNGGATWAARPDQRYQ